MQRILLIIYIPLWFYFNDLFHGKTPEIPEFTFHYGSTLIRIPFRFSMPSIIYIPLWFYFNLVVKFKYIVNI